MNIEQLIAGADLTANRIEILTQACDMGASEDVLVVLRDALRVSRGNRIILPAHRYESLSRGRGWARKGKGNGAVWGDRVDGGYKVDPGAWVVGATDGFSRKAQESWVVKHVDVCGQIWTVAS